jgi:hypothetical protein
MKIYVIRKPYLWQPRGVETVCFDVFLGSREDDSNRLFFNRIIQNIDVAREYAKELTRRKPAEVVFIDKIEIV